MRRTLTAAALSTALLVAGAPLASSAVAKGGDDRVIRTGSCSGTADWKLKAKSDDGRIEVEAEIDSDVSGQVWTWRILHNGGVSAKGRATTKPPSGSFEVERLLVNAPGTDNIGVRSTNVSTGETCAGNLQF